MILHAANMCICIENEYISPAPKYKFEKKKRKQISKIRAQLPCTQIAQTNHTTYRNTKKKPKFKTNSKPKLSEPKESEKTGETKITLSEGW